MPNSDQNKFSAAAEGSVEAIAAVQTGNSGFHQDVPVEDIVVEKVTVSEAKD